MRGDGEVRSRCMARLVDSPRLKTGLGGAAVVETVDRVHDGVAKAVQPQLARHQTRSSLYRCTDIGVMLLKRIHRPYK